MKNNIATFRKSIKLSQKQLADLLGIHERLIQKYEHDISVPSVETAIRLAKALNTTVEELFALEDEV